MADGRQTLIGVVLPVKQPVFAAGGHNAVRFLGALGHQIVHQCSDIAVGTFENHGVPAQKLQGGIDTGHKALDGGFLIAGRAVELASTVQTANFLSF